MREENTRLWSDYGDFCSSYEHPVGMDFPTLLWYLTGRKRTAAAHNIALVYHYCRWEAEDAFHSTGESAFTVSVPNIMVIGLMAKPTALNALHRLVTDGFLVLVEKRVGKSSVYELGDRIEEARLRSKAYFENCDLLYGDKGIYGGAA